MKTILRFLLMALIWLSLSAHDGSCTTVEPPATPILYSVEVVETSDGDLLIETTDTSATLEIKGRNDASSSRIEICKTATADCFTPTEENAGFPYRVTFNPSTDPSTPIAGTYSVAMINTTDESRESNPCSITIHN